MSRSPRGGQVYCDVEEHLPAIRADREALSRALWNLLENAAQVLGRRHARSTCSPDGRATRCLWASATKAQAFHARSSGRFFRSSSAASDAKRVGRSRCGHRPGARHAHRRGAWRLRASRERARPRQHVHAGASMSRILIVEDDCGDRRGAGGRPAPRGLHRRAGQRRRGGAAASARSRVRSRPARRDAAKEGRLRRLPRAAALERRVAGSSC